METIAIICDYGDGKPAADQVTLAFSGRRLVIDLCSSHLSELTKNARAPRRGRKRKVAAAPVTKRRAPVAKRRGRPTGSKNKAQTRNGRRKTGRKRAAKKA